MRAMLFVRVIPFLIFLVGCEQRPANFSAYKLPLSEEKFDSAEGEKLRAAVANERANVSALLEAADSALRLTRKLGDESLLGFAGELIARVRKIDPGNVNARLLEARIVETRHGFADAIAIAGSVLETSPQSRQALYILVTSHLALGRLPEAARYVDRLASLYPRTGVLALRGLVLVTQGRDKEGVTELQRALAVEDIGEASDSSWARSVLGRYFLERGDLASAKALISEAVRIQPGSAFALDLLAQVLAQKGDAAEADGLLEDAFVSSRQLAHLRHQAELNDHIGKKQLAHDQWAQVEKLIRSELEKGRDDHRLDLAKVLVKRNSGGDLKEAILLLREELGLRQNGDTIYLSALAHAELGLWVQAEEAVNAYLRLGTRNPQAYGLASRIFKGRGNERKAILYAELQREILGNHTYKSIFL